jgi:hypothetical protein
MMRITPARAIAEPRLLAKGFRGDSWNRWRACLRCSVSASTTSSASFS